MWSGNSSVVRAPDSQSKGPGFKSRQEWWMNFLLQGQLSVLTLILVSNPPPFCRPHVTAVACKWSLSFCQKCRWQVTAKHTYTLPMWLWMKWHCKQVYGWMVYTELALRWQQFHMAPAMQQQMSVIRTPLPWILKICATKRIQSLICSVAHDNEQGEIFYSAGPYMKLCYPH